jgi:hypothetical protein
MFNITDLIQIQNNELNYIKNQFAKGSNKYCIVDTSKQMTLTDNESINYYGVEVKPKTFDTELHAVNYINTNNLNNKVYTYTPLKYIDYLFDTIKYKQIVINTLNNQLI